MSKSVNPPAIPRRERIAGRYRVDGVLGQGGVAVVYRVVDTATDRTLALKQLALPREHEQYADTAALFEREFYTLRQLSHPRIIEVFEYGLDDIAPYYTMELLDGGDLRERTPLPWREACALLFDVCSSLALLHSRGLLHRDVSPRNIRCTKDGRVKLIDFGAMVPFGPCRSIVGTPPFAAPELVQRGTLDGRSDLFSLGACLYTALTGRLAYPARRFAELAACWRARPAPPSSLKPEIPSALDALVMSMISLDAAARPRSAAEVMQRMAAIAGIARTEADEVSQAYLAAPVLVGRRSPLMRFHKRLVRALRGRGGAVLIAGAAGVGRSRMLDACALDAQVLGATVLRAGALGTKPAPFAIARALIEQLIEAQPELATRAARVAGEARLRVFDTAEGEGVPLRLKDLSAHANDREVQALLCDWLLRICQDARVVIAVDDVHHADAASAALFAGLSQGASTCRMLLIGTLPSGAAASSPAPAAIELFAQSASVLELTPLAEPDMAALLRSVFGDVPNLGPISDAVFALTRGNPRECMELAQHLIDTRAVRYEGGTWCLPVRLDAAALPRSIEDALAQRIAGFSETARWLAECQALAQSDRFDRADYVALVDGASVAQADAALNELLSRQVVTGDGIVFALAHGGLRAALVARLSADEIAARHRALARMCAQRGRHVLVVVHHEFAGEQLDQALDRLSAFLDGMDAIDRLVRVSTLLPAELAALFERALESAERLQRKPREVYTFRRWVTQFSVTADDRLYWRAAPAWLSRLKLDSGLDAYNALDPAIAPNERLMSALTAAAARHQATPEAERVYSPEEAIRLLVYFVGVSIAVGARTQHEPLMESLPDLLEPFAALSPVIRALWQNALGARDNTTWARVDVARTRWLEVWNELNALSGSPGVDMRYVEIVRNAVAYALASVDARRGVSSALHWLAQLEGDPLQGVSVLYLRRSIRMQQGDWEGAERHRREAELFAVQTNIRPMFTTSLHFELEVGVFAGDLATVERVRGEIEPIAREHPGWVPLHHLADGWCHRLRGDLSNARASFERCLDECTWGRVPGYRYLMAWAWGCAAYIDALVELGEYAAAKDCGVRAIERCLELELHGLVHDVTRPLALAEAKLREFESANDRLRAMLARQLGLGVTGVNLGATYEACARVAIEAGDQSAFEGYAELAAVQYRRGEGSALGARYERLLADAERAGMLASARVARSVGAYGTETGIRTNPRSVVAKLMRGADTRADRAERALRMMVEAKAASAGHLFLLGDCGLELAASCDAPEVPPGLVSAMRVYLEAEAKASDTATLIVTDLSGSSSATSAWADTGGTSYRAVPLSSTIDGITTYVGVAALVLGTHAPDQIGVPQLLAALGEHLLAAGDARALRVAL